MYYRYRNMIPLPGEPKYFSKLWRAFLSILTFRILWIFSGKLIKNFSGIVVLFLVGIILIIGTILRFLGLSG